MKEGGDVKEKEEEDHQRSFSKEPPAVPAARDLQLDQQQTEDDIVFLLNFSNTNLAAECRPHKQVHSQRLRKASLRCPRMQASSCSQPLATILKKNLRKILMIGFYLCTTVDVLLCLVTINPVSQFTLD